MDTKEKGKSFQQAQWYQITVYGTVDPSWSEWFGGLKLARSINKNGLPITQFDGVLPDQGALRGVLIKLWDLNLSLRSLKSREMSITEEIK